MSELAGKRCRPTKGVPTLSRDEATRLLAELGGWSLDGDATAIHRRFEFRSYPETLAFVNAVAWMAHREDHHPDLEIGYRRCTVRYSTHDVGGLSENDFICAAKVDALLA